MMSSGLGNQPSCSVAPVYCFLGWAPLKERTTQRCSLFSRVSGLNSILFGWVNQSARGKSWVLEPSKDVDS